MAVRKRKRGDGQTGGGNIARDVQASMRGMMFKRTQEMLTWQSRKIILLAESFFGKTTFCAGLQKFAPVYIIELDFDGAAFVPRNVPVQYCHYWDHVPEPKKGESNEDFVDRLAQDIASGEIGFKQIVHLCLETLDPGTIVVVDTGDALYFTRERQLLNDRGLDSMPEDHGKAYNAIAHDIREQMHLLASKFGLIIPIHITDVEIRIPGSNTTITKTKAALPPSSWKVFKEMADISLVGSTEFLEDDTGNRVPTRVWRADVTGETYDMGSRLALTEEMFPVDSDAYVKVMEASMAEWKKSSGQSQFRRPPTVQASSKSGQSRESSLGKAVRRRKQSA